MTTVDNATGETVSKATLPAFSMDLDVDCINASNGALITDGNITTTASGVIKANMANCTAGGDYGLCGYDWNCTYSYVYGREAYEGVNETVGATSKIPAWLGIIVILFIVGLVIAILFNVFPRTGTGGFSFGRRSSGGVTAEI